MRTAHNRNDGSSNNLGVLLVRNGVGIAPHGLTDLQKVGDVPLPWHPQFHRSCLHNSIVSILWTNFFLK